MNITTLEAALASFTTSSLTAVTSNNQTLISSTGEANVRKPAVNVRWAFQEETPVAGGGIGRPMTALRYIATIDSQGVTEAARKDWLRELRYALHHRRAPTGVTGLDHAEVISTRMVPHPVSVGTAGSTTAARAEVECVFVGDVHPDDGGS